MVSVDRKGVALYYEVEGDGETVAFLGDLGLGAWQWGWQHAALAGPYEVVVSDMRGTGRSDTPPGPYSVESLAADLEAVLADHGTARAHLVGAGLGGMVALEYGRARSLTLIGSSPGGPHAPLPRDPREALFASPDDPKARRESLPALFSETFLTEQSEACEGIAEWRAGDAAREGWDAQNAAFEAFDASDWLYEVTIPALVVHGERDELVPVENAALPAEGLPRATREIYDGAGHGVWIERSRPVNDRLLDFLNSLD
ncbi:alpha/beta fold hydrolase [Halalkalicoccus jeotgali]|uniref:Alpha/beta hydrolase fold protein n=1 Tax=Halalkalicoccus jeotgali (strain DSM 18796 / CECT 7217 / JCM 14584 / KCTC 4019 / B3) TaxID=795797 RepID=D8J548_HALJB|nr:alpha/beta hydrolase [Halalkalicoccus jeotgali]ADJ13629.1 alpha/beta hydrolase fold protein [Halalkalicoccus jeotgali B3]ELY33349.1 alpha/beta hydrolase fold protein [Halalkalicoccus jeotgali B3]